MSFARGTRVIACLVAFGAVAAAGGAAIPASADPRQSAHCTDSRAAGAPSNRMGTPGIQILTAGETGPWGVRRVANTNGLSLEQASRVLADPSTRVDDCAVIFFADPQYHAADSVSSRKPRSLDSSGDPFALNSRPGSARTIYLDFDGYVLTGTGWNSYLGYPNGSALVGYDLDSDPKTFADTEEAAIAEIWLRVAEDYAPFNVNVTTQYPGEAALERTDDDDTSYGITVVITNDSRLPATCGCGGVAYLRAIEASGLYYYYYQPALVSVLGVSKDTRAIAESASHEAGHNFGLSHDGSTDGAAYYAGQGAWAPIMGVSYNLPLSQWSNGDYAGANNAESDLGIIALNAPLMADDHSGEPAGATRISPNVSAHGLIATSNDADYFTFTLAGTSTQSALRVIPQGTGGNLDAQLDILASDGSLVASANPAVPVPAPNRNSITGLGARIDLDSLPPGTYYARVKGTGQGDPKSTGYSAYASLGRYRVVWDETPTPALVIPAQTLPKGTTGAQYSGSLKASGGTPGYSWELTSGGALPPGVALSPLGVLSGTPTQAGTYPLAVTVTDTDGATARATLTMMVRSSLAIATRSLPAGRRGDRYAVRLTATGADGAAAWSVSSGSLPRGLSLSLSGQISGVPRSRTIRQFTVKVKDAGGRTATRVFSLRVR